MKIVLSDRNIVVVLFVMVLITFSLAQEDSKEMEKGLLSASVASTAQMIAELPVEKLPAQASDGKMQ